MPKRSTFTVDVPIWHDLTKREWEAKLDNFDETLQELIGSDTVISITPILGAVEGAGSATVALICIVESTEPDE